jgi:hypothetical protein
MDFEMAIWEMTSLIIAPKKVFRSIYYHKRVSPSPKLNAILSTDTVLETKNTWHRPDPSFTYLLSFFLLLTSIAWGVAYADGFGPTLHITLAFIFIHFVVLSLTIATICYFLVGRLLGPGVKGLPGRRRQGLFNVEAGEDGNELEFGYCWDVAIRAFVPIWVFLYVAQFILMPVVASRYWYV